MKVSYGVVWREGEAPDAAGLLGIEPHALVLRPLEDQSAVEREFAFDEIAAVEIRPPVERPTLVLRSQSGREAEIESAVDKWILGDLLERIFVHGLGGAQDSRRILVAMKLRPGCREQALELLRGGPPFDPAGTGLALHEVFLLEDEALFLFATHAGEDLERLVEPDFWRSAAAWRELVSGGVRLAEPVYSWHREDAGAHHVGHLGLGL